MIPGVRRAFYWMSPLPLISLAGVLIYLNGLEGWGAWAGGVLVVIPMTLSLVVAAFGGVLIYRAKKSGRCRLGAVVGDPAGRLGGSVVCLHPGAGRGAAQFFLD